MEDSSNNNIVCCRPPTSARRNSINDENEIQKLLDSGLQLLTKIKSWYSHQKSQIYSYEIAELPKEDVVKIRDINDRLRSILMTQRNENKSSDMESCSQHVEELKILEDRVLKLESEKSLLIRELFQLKAQMKSPANNPYI